MSLIHNPIGEIPGDLLAKVQWSFATGESAIWRKSYWRRSGIPRFRAVKNTNGPHINHRLYLPNVERISIVLRYSSFWIRSSLNFRMKEVFLYRYDVKF